MTAQDEDLLAHNIYNLPMNVDTAEFHRMQVSDMYDSNYFTINSRVLEFDVGRCCIWKKLKSVIELSHIKINSIQKLSHDV